MILHLITDSPFLIFQPSENLPELIERTVFHTYGRLINNTYKRKMRSLVFILKHRDSIREKVVTGEISVKKLVSSSVEQLTEKIYNLVVYHVGQTVFIFMLNKHTIFLIMQDLDKGNIS